MTHLKVFSLMIKVGMIGMKALERTLRSMAKSNQSPSQEMALIGRRMLKMQKSHFDKQEDPHGMPWPELSPATIAARRKGSEKGIAHRAPVPLRDTGRMYNSMASKTTTYDAAVGTNVPYAKDHQFGTDKIPARPFLYITATERRDLVRMLTDPLILMHLRKQRGGDIIEPAAGG